MFDDHDCCAARHEPVEHAQQHAHVERVQTDGRLIEHEYRVRLGLAHFTGEFQPLGFAARKRRRRFAERQVAEAQVVQGGQTCVNLLEVAGHGQRLVHAHRHELRQAQGNVAATLIRRLTQFFLGSFAFIRDLHLRRFALSRFNRTPNRVGFGRIAGASTIRAFDGHVRQELHIERD